MTFCRGCKEVVDVTEGWKGGGSFPKVCVKV